MKYLIDSDVLINCLKAIESDLSFLEKYYTISNISLISYGEVLQVSKNKDNLKDLKLFLSLFEPISIDNKIQEDAVNLLEMFHLSSGLMFFDALIASTAINNNLTLVTRNTKHYKNIPNLKIKTP